MSVDYNLAAINARLQGVVDTIDAFGSGNFIVLAGVTVLSTIQLSIPCGTVNGGVLTLGGTLLDPAAVATGDADSCIIQDALGNSVVTGLSIGIPFSGSDVIISNGLNNTLIVAGDVVELSGQITGS